MILKQSSSYSYSYKVSMVSRLKHENFVEMLGYCVDGNQRVLAYEFASNGSLHDILHGTYITYQLYIILPYGAFVPPS